jgi:hypothetical protein
VARRDSGVGWTIVIASHRVTELKIDGKGVIGGQISRSGKSVVVEQGNVNGPSSAHTIDVIPFFGGPATELLAHADDATWNR